MLRTTRLLGPLLGLAALLPSLPRPADPDPVSSRILTTAAGERILAQELRVDAPVEAVWEAYTTAAGWRRWAAPVAEVDLRVGGTIRTHYEPGAAIGDEGTNTLHIVNYVPLEVLTLRAEVGPNWPEILRQDADRLSNVILFDRLGERRTRVRSYGIGYRDAPELEELLRFFQSANEGLLERLREVLEEE